MYLTSFLFNATRLTTCFCLILQLGAYAAEQWRPVPGRMMTRWAREVSPQNAWTEYPRPQFVRENWRNLNGLWDYAVTEEQDKAPNLWQGQILVPFALESSLSGVGRQLNTNQTLWYRRLVDLSPKKGQRTLLNFEAVDYHSTVWVNGTEMGQNIGGSIAFQFDITQAIRAGTNEIVVRVWDPSEGTQLRGKQSRNPQGIWYSQASGIWQTVWLEEVPATHLRDVKLTTAIDPPCIKITPSIVGPSASKSVLRVRAVYKGKTAGTAKGQGEIKISLPDARLWSPGHPEIYELELALVDSKGAVIDTVKSYAGLREVGMRRDSNGTLRFTLNGEDIFHWGTLDQGWWPDGLLTPPSEAAMRYDVDFLKKAGFNMIRKHVKVESRRYYAYCDRAGMLLWQDQVSPGFGTMKEQHKVSPPWIRLGANPVDAEWSETAHAQWMKEFRGMIDQLQNHPSIVVWTPFNEAWGQHRTLEIGKWAMDYDPSRHINIASGGNFWPVGHIVAEHRYPSPSFPLYDARFTNYVKVIGEFGGHGWPEHGHLWSENIRNWGHGGLPNFKGEFVSKYERSISALKDLKARGLSGAVYTQTTDVEGEINGLLTYDREISKIPAEQLANIHKQLGPEIER